MPTKFILILLFVYINLNCTTPTHTTHRISVYKILEQPDTISKKQFDLFIKRFQDSCKCIFIY